MVLVGVAASRAGEGGQQRDAALPRLATDHRGRRAGTGAALDAARQLGDSGLDASDAGLDRWTAVSLDLATVCGKAWLTLFAAVVIFGHAFDSGGHNLALGSALGGVLADLRPPVLCFVGRGTSAGRRRRGSRP